MQIKNNHFKFFFTMVHEIILLCQLKLFKRQKIPNKREKNQSKN